MPRIRSAAKPNKIPLACLDLEGILVPEIWINVSRRTGIEELKLTTRDIPDYDVLMRRRLKILKREGLKLSHIQKVIATMNPLAGARPFFDRLRRTVPAVILSDTFLEFAGPLMLKLGDPALFCNRLIVNKSGTITGYTLRQPDGKTKAVKAFKSLGFSVRAVGDSFNDVGMLQAADRAFFFHPPSEITKLFPKIPVTASYGDLFEKLLH